MNPAFLTTGCRRIERLRLSPEKLKITGFQSPAGDHEQGPLSIDEFVGRGAPQHKWLWIADSDALAGLGIYQHDVLVVNRVGKADPGRSAIGHTKTWAKLVNFASRKCRRQVVWFTCPTLFDVTSSSRSLLSKRCGVGDTFDLFAMPARCNAGRLMEVIDALNVRFGRGAVRIGTTSEGGRKWEVRRGQLSSVSTGSWGTFSLR